MTLARTNAVAIVGVVGHVVQVEADLARGLPGLTLVGLPDAALSESRCRALTPSPAQSRAAAASNA